MAGTRALEGPLYHYFRALAGSTRNNMIAYGYSAAATASFAVIGDLRSHHVVDAFLFVGGAGAAFALVNVGVTQGFRRGLPEEPSVVVALATSFSALSAAVSVGVAALVAWALHGWLAWLLGSFGFSLAYLLAVGLETSVATALHAGEEEDPP